MFRLVFLTLLVFCSFFVFSCGDNDSTTGTSGNNSAGVYQILSYTKNTEGCLAEGPSQLGSNSASHFVVFSYNFFGTNITQMLSCSSTLDCQNKATNTINGDYTSVGLLVFSYTFSSGNSASGYSGATASSGFTSSENICKNPSLEDVTLQTAGADSLLFEGQKKLGDDYPANAEGFCTSDLGAAASEGKPCSEYTVIRGVKVGDLSL